MRLVKYLAHSGVASRRQSEVMIAAGRVSIDGQVILDPARDIPDGGGVDVRVDGRSVAPERTEVWAVNKPLDVTSTAREPGSRTAVVELVDSKRRLYPVGRLDADSTGLILLTNDGALANQLTHPRYGVRRTYRVTLKRKISDSQIKRLAKGVTLDDGPTLPAEIKRHGTREIEITMREGRNRQVRRMAQKVANEVVALRRVGFGSLRLGTLALGASRRLSPAEIEALWKDARRRSEREETERYG